MRIALLPRTNLGKCSLGAMIIFFIFFYIRKLLFLLSPVSTGTTCFDPPIIGLLMIGAWIGGCMSFLTGTVSILKKEENSVLVLFSMLFGFCILLFGLSEFLYPH